MTWFSRVLAGATLAAALAFATGAGAAPQATLPVPNPGFETDCGGGTTTCNWASTGFALATRDTTQFHSGVASLKLDSTVMGGAASSRSDCFSGVTAGTTYYFSLWYRTNDTKVSTMEPRVEFWNSAACNNSTVTQDLTLTPIRDGAWHFVQGPALVAPATSTHGTVQLGMICVFGQFDCESNYDDVKIETVPTAVLVASVAAHRSAAGVDLTWRAPSTVDTLGFNVWRSNARGVQFSKLNRSLVLGRGAAYRYVDRTALPGRAYVYKLQLVRPDGSRVWAASVRVAAARS